MQIGVITDTHGKMRPKVLEVLKGSDLILHAGDVSCDGVLEALEAIAPVMCFTSILVLLAPIALICRSR
jgi:hypothetical protein